MSLQVQIISYRLGRHWIICHIQLWMQMAKGDPERLCPAYLTMHWEFKPMPYLPNFFRRPSKAPLKQDRMKVTSPKEQWYAVFLGKHFPEKVMLAQVSFFFLHLFPQLNPRRNELFRFDKNTSYQSLFTVEIIALLWSRAVEVSTPAKITYVWRLQEPQGGPRGKERRNGRCTALNIESGQVAADDSDPQRENSTWSAALEKENTKLANPNSKGAMLDPLPHHPNSSCRKEIHRLDRPHPIRHRH